jgi:serine/threonine protein kinase
MSTEDSILSGLDPAGLFDLGGGSNPGTNGGASHWEPPTPAHLAALFPRWEILGLLGRGGMGAVYHARQPDLDREIAIKLLPIEASADEVFVQRFQREARTLAKLRHPNIVALHEFGTTPEGHPFFVMEYVDGSTLAEKIGKLSVPEALEIVRQACDALSHAHSLGIVHRDIKPSNILLDTAGHIKIADFGLAKWDQQHEAAMTLSRTGGFMGTAEYAAPEQVKDAAHADHRADIYSIGVLFYEMLTGERPRGVFRPPSAKSGSDPRLDPMVLRALQENPGERYQAAADLREELARLHRRTHPLLWVTVFLCMVLTAAVVILLLKDRPTRQHSAEMLATTPPPAAELPASANATAPLPVMPEPAEPTASAITETPPSKPEPAKPSAPASSPSNSRPKVFSFSAVDPRFYPPATFLTTAWKSCTLTSKGGAVLTQSGQLLLWDARWKSPREVIPAEPIVQLSSTTEQALALGESGTLYRLVDADSPEILSGPPISLLGTCPNDNILPVILKSGELYLFPLTPKYPPSTFSAPPDVRALCLTYSGKVHLLDAAGNLHVSTREKTEVIRNNISAIASGEQHVALLSKGGAVEILDGDPAPTDLGKILHITAARNATFAVQEDGRAVIFNSTGGKVHRYRLESGTAPVIVSPAGLLIAQ